MQSHRWQHFCLVILLMLVPLYSLVPTRTVTAQDPAGIPIEFDGPVEAIDETTTTIGGYTVDIELVVLDQELEIGLVVHVLGFLQQDGVIIALSLTDPDDDMEDGDTIVISGEVEAIGDNTVTMNSLTIDISGAEFDVELEVGVVIVIVINVPSDAVIIAIEINLPDNDQDDDDQDEDDDDQDDDQDDNDDVIIVIEGPVESIDVNVIVVYGITIVLDGDTTVLGDLQIGDIVLIEGDGDFENGVLVVVVINITVIEVEIIVPGGGGGDDDDDDDDD